MNEHLLPVFDVLLAELERGGIKYWVYGGVGIAAVAGEFFRHNRDIDIFLADADFADARLNLRVVCEQKKFKLQDRRPLGKRPKFEVIDGNGREILSVVPVYPNVGVVEFIFGHRPTQYSDQILVSTPRNICGNRFFTPPDKWIKELFKTYVRNRPQKKKCEKVQKDAQKILCLEERRELQIPEPTEKDA